MLFCFLTYRTEQSGQSRGGHGLSHDLAAGRHVVHESAGLPVRGVHGAQEAPGLRQQLTDGGGPHLGERCASVHAAEVGQVADEVELVCHHTQTRVLQHAEACRETAGTPVSDRRNQEVNDTPVDMLYYLTWR